MTYFVPRHFKASDGSHIPILTKVLQLSDGPVLELGMGFFSTPVIHWLCAPTERKIVSYDSQERFIEVGQNFVRDFHEVILAKDWSKIDIESQHWSVVLVDHAPGEQRQYEFARVANNADYVVVHDTEARSDKHYHYSKIAPLYKYRYDYDKVYPHTSVFSNFKDLSNL